MALTANMTRTKCLFSQHKLCVSICTHIQSLFKLSHKTKKKKRQQSRQSNGQNYSRRLTTENLSPFLFRVAALLTKQAHNQSHQSCYAPSYAVLN